MMVCHLWRAALVAAAAAYSRHDADVVYDFEGSLQGWGSAASSEMQLDVAARGGELLGTVRGGAFVSEPHLDSPPLALSAAGRQTVAIRMGVPGRRRVAAAYGGAARRRTTRATTAPTTGPARVGAGRAGYGSVVASAWAGAGDGWALRDGDCDMEDAGGGGPKSSRRRATLTDAAGGTFLGYAFERAVAVRCVAICQSMLAANRAESVTLERRRRKLDATQRALPAAATIAKANPCKLSHTADDYDRKRREATTGDARGRAGLGRRDGDAAEGAYVGENGYLRRGVAVLDKMPWYNGTDRVERSAYGATFACPRNGGPTLTIRGGVGSVSARLQEGAPSKLLGALQTTGYVVHYKVDEARDADGFYTRGEDDPFAARLRRGVWRVETTARDAFDVEGDAGRRAARATTRRWALSTAVAKRIALVGLRARTFALPLVPTAACGPAVRLTPAAPRRAGAVWYGRRLNVREGFDTTFVLRPSDPSRRCGVMDGAHTRCRSRGGDGFAFVVQTDGPAALGGEGALGHGGLRGAVAVEFDTYYNPEPQPYENHVAVHARGRGAPSSAHHEAALASSAAPGPRPLPGREFRVVRVVYDPAFDAGLAQLDAFEASPAAAAVFVDDLDAPVVVAPLNLDALLSLHHGRAYVGLTAATGLDTWQVHDVLQWNFTMLRKDPPIDMPPVVNGAGSHACAHGAACVHV
ncbi:hypothetical protein JL722_13115 [Aureococcus anophagefferens]|nr:hypothetical protein JL722_13115 [Aureococcus anophagefferens]